MDKDKTIEFASDHPDLEGYDHNAIKRILVAEHKAKLIRVVLNMLNNMDEDNAKDALIESLSKKLSWTDIDNLSILIMARNT